MMNNDIKDMFDSYSTIDSVSDKLEAIILFAGLGFRIFHRSTKFHHGEESNNIDNVVMFYKELKNGSSFRKARKISGLNYKESVRWVEFFNREYFKRFGTVFFKIHLTIRIRRHKKKISDQEFENFLEEIDVENMQVC